MGVSKFMELDYVVWEMKKVLVLMGMTILGQIDLSMGINGFRS